MRTRLLAGALLVFAAGLPALAQVYPGPVPPPQYPGSGPPMNRKGKTTSSESKSKAKPDEDLVRATGKVIKLDEKSIDIAADDSRYVSAQITSQTVWPDGGKKVETSGIEVGAHVTLVSRADEDGNLTALRIEVAGATDLPKDKTATIASAPTPADDEDGPPKLKRGKPELKKTTEAEPEETASLGIPPVQPPAPQRRAEPIPEPQVEKGEGTIKSPATKNALIEKAREATEGFTEHLPNFTCQQFTTRYELVSKSEGWEPADVVSAEVSYHDGVEQYSNVKVGSHKTDKGIMDMKGQRSNGEFASIVNSLLSPSSDASFQFVKDSVIGRHSVKAYDFVVRRERSNWRVENGGQRIIPGYSGRVWIDKESARVIRLERQADKIPEAFPFDKIEQTVEYAVAMIGSRNITLPSRSENLSCDRGSSYCHRNVIEFRNYREFRGEAKIEYEEPR